MTFFNCRWTQYHPYKHVLPKFSPIFSFHQCRHWYLWQQIVVIHRCCLPKSFVTLHNTTLPCRKWHRRLCSFTPLSARISSDIWRNCTRNMSGFFSTASSQNLSIPTLRTFLLLYIFVTAGIFQMSLEVTHIRPRWTVQHGDRGYRRFNCGQICIVSVSMADTQP